MNAVKGICRDGIIELIEGPPVKGQREVLVIFPDEKKSVIKIGGMFKDSSINYDDIARELKNKSSYSEDEILREAKNQ